MDVEAAISTIDRAIAYTQPLRRRTEGITWVLFGLSSALFVFSYVWIWDRGYDTSYRLMLVWLVGYAILAIGPGLLVWRVASVAGEGYAIDTKRVAAAAILVGVLLVALNYALWGIFGATRLAIALNIVGFGGAVWAGLAIGQWSRLSSTGRRDTCVLAATMALVGFALVYILRADATTVGLDALIFVTTMGLMPTAAGLWRLARG
jgi:hypothetical protein